MQGIVERYRNASRSEKGRVLDEFVKLTGYHRKHAVRLPNSGPQPFRRRVTQANGFAMRRSNRPLSPCGKRQIGSVGND